MLTRSDIQTLVPHQGEIVLIDWVESWDPEAILCTSLSHRSITNPLRRAGRLPVLCGVEYGAQAMAIHGALLRSGGARAGMLAALRSVQCHADDLDRIQGALTIQARKEIGGDDRFIYLFTLRDGERLLLEGQAAVVLQ